MVLRWFSSNLRSRCKNPRFIKEHKASIPPVTCFGCLFMTNLNNRLSSSHSFLHQTDAEVIVCSYSSRLANRHMTKQSDYAHFFPTTSVPGHCVWVCLAGLHIITYLCSADPRFQPFPLWNLVFDAQEGFRTRDWGKPQSTSALLTVPNHWYLNSLQLCEDAFGFKCVGEGSTCQPHVDGFSYDQVQILVTMDLSFPPLSLVFICQIKCAGEIHVSQGKFFSRKKENILASPCGPCKGFTRFLWPRNSLRTKSPSLVSRSAFNIA